MDAYQLLSLCSLTDQPLSRVIWLCCRYLHCSYNDRQGLESAFAASSSTALPPLPRFGGLSELGCLDGFDRDYELGEEIGSGSFGTVFVASSLHDGEEVAVKVCCRQGSDHFRGSSVA